MDPIHFSLGSMAQYVSAGPLALVGFLGNLLLDICEADTEYQVEMARIEAEEQVNLRIDKLTSATRQKIDLLKSVYKKRIKKRELDWQAAEAAYQKAIIELLKEGGR